jgi:tRNA(adenine34) deaminase
MNFEIEPYSHKYYMNLALNEANEAYKKNEIPVGALLVCDNKIIAKAYNQTQLLNDATAHAEILAITTASNNLGTRHLHNCTLYVTLEPCAMCASAIHWAQIPRIVYAASDLKKGYSQYTPSILSKKCIVENDVMQQESEDLLKTFFKKLR